MIVFALCAAVVAGAAITLAVLRSRHAAKTSRARESGLPLPAAVHTPLLISLASLVAVGPMGALLLALLPPVQSVFGELACPPGWTLKATSTSGFDASTHHGAVCWRGEDFSELSPLYFVACGTLVGALAACVGLALTARRWAGERERQKLLEVSAGLG